MDKKIAGLIGAVSALASCNVAQAATASHVQDVMTVNSYDDLLQPIPNAVETLKASNAVLDEQAAADGDAKLEMAQYYYHHHHHHRFFRPFYRHHHHHHHRFYHHHHHRYYPY